MKTMRTKMPVLAALVELLLALPEGAEILVPAKDAPAGFSAGQSVSVSGSGMVTFAAEAGQIGPPGSRVETEWSWTEELGITVRVKTPRWRVESEAAHVQRHQPAVDALGRELPPYPG